MSRPAHLVLLAMVYGKVGQPDEGLATVAAARALLDTDERTYEAELRRLEAELMLERARRTDGAPPGAPDAAVDAEACFQKPSRCRADSTRGPSSCERWWA